MFADSSSIYIYIYPPRRPVRDEGVDGGVGDGVLVHGLVVRHALVLEPVSPEDLLRHVGGADLQCWELEWLHHGLNIIELSPATHIFNWLQQKFRNHFLLSFPFWLRYSFNVGKNNK